MKSGFKRKLFLMAAISMAPLAYGHGDHAEPGSLPPPPHGGNVSEAEHKHDGAENKGEKELFIEVSLKGNKLHIYPLYLDPNNSKVFGLGKPAEFAKAELKVEFPRSKKVVPAAIKAEGDFWTADLPSASDRRLIAHVSVVHGTETKTAKVQVEKK